MNLQNKNQFIGILGGGTWGTTLAVHLHNQGFKVTLWEFSPDRAELLARTRKLATLPQLSFLPEDIQVTNDLSTSIVGKDTLLMVVPSKAYRETINKIAQFGNKIPNLIISATKGLEYGTLNRMTQIIEQTIPNPENYHIGVISGPSHAEEVCQQKPAALVAASRDEQTARQIQSMFMSPNFRVYTNTDIAGVELGAALKNVYAIASGICDGLKLGDNSKAALLTRSLAELSRIGTKLGGELSTFYGLAGVGDLVVTCYSKFSRNRTFGEKFALTQNRESAEREIGMVIEGITTVEAMFSLARDSATEMPVAAEVYAILFQNKPVAQAITDLLGRPARPEWDE